METLFNSSLMPMLMVLPIFYFLVFRPKQKEIKETAKMQKALSRGDKVLTQSGIIGSIQTVKDESFIILSADSKLEISKSSIVKKMEK